MLARCVATLKPPPELTLSQWADRYRMLSAESSAEPGRWHTDKAPYQREIMDAIGDAHIRRVVIMCAAQLGKTELLLNMYHLAVELEKKYYRKTTAQELDVELEWLRNLVRMAADKDLCGAKFAPPLSMHQYETWARYNTEIGCLLGKYIASVKK